MASPTVDCGDWKGRMRYGSYRSGEAGREYGSYRSILGIDPLAGPSAPLEYYGREG